MTSGKGAPPPPPRRRNRGSGSGDGKRSASTNGTVMASLDGSPGPIGGVATPRTPPHTRNEDAFGGLEKVSGGGGAAGLAVEEYNHGHAALRQRPARRRADELRRRNHSGGHVDEAPEKGSRGSFVCKGKCSSRSWQSDFGGPRLGPASVLVPWYSYSTVARGEEDHPHATQRNEAILTATKF